METYTGTENARFCKNCKYSHSQFLLEPLFHGSYQKLFSVYYITMEELGGLIIREIN